MVFWRELYCIARISKFFSNFPPLNHRSCSTGTHINNREAPPFIEESSPIDACHQSLFTALPICWTGQVAFAMLLLALSLLAALLSLLFCCCCLPTLVCSSDPEIPPTRRRPPWTAAGQFSRSLADSPPKFWSGIGVQAPFGCWCSIVVIMLGSSTVFVLLRPVPESRRRRRVVLP